MNTPSIIKKTTLYTFLFLGLGLAYLGWWHTQDNRPLTWDPTVHLGLAADYRDWLIERTPITNSRTSMYPPLYHISLIPALMAGVPSEGKAVVTHVLYAAIFLLSILGLVKRWKRPEEDAYIAAGLCFAFSIVTYTFCYALTDFPLMAFVTLGMWLLYRTDHFTDRRASLIWGVAAALGLLVKQPYPFYFFLPCLWFLLSPTRTNATRRERWIHFAMACGVILLLAGPWYWWQSIFGLQNGLGQAFERGTAQHLPDFKTLEGWMYYIRLLPDQMGVPVLVATGLGILLLPWSGLQRPAGIFLALWVLSGYVGMTFIHNKDPRYDIGIFPAIALLSAIGWSGGMSSPQGRRYIALAGALGLWFWTASHTNRPLREDWKHEPIGQLLASRRDTDQPFMIASVEANDPHFFGRSLRWSLRRQGATLFNAAPGDPMADFTEFVIVKVGDKGPDAGPIADEWQQLQGSGRRFTSLFPLIGTFDLPDGSRATLYQRQKDHVFQVSPATREGIESRLKGALAELIEGPMTVQLTGSSTGLKAGRIDQGTIAGGPWTLRGIPIAKANLEIHRAWLNLYTLWDLKKPGLLAFEDIRPHLEIHAIDLQTLLARKVRELSDPQVRFEGGLIRVEARWKNIPLQVVASLRLTESPAVLEARLERLRIGILPISPWLLGRAHAFEVPLYPTPPLPGHLRIQRIVAENGVLTID